MVITYICTNKLLSDNSTRLVLNWNTGCFNGWVIHRQKNNSDTKRWKTVQVPLAESLMEGPFLACPPPSFGLVFDNDHHSPQQLSGPAIMLNAPCYKSSGKRTHPVCVEMLYATISCFPCPLKSSGEIVTIIIQKISNLDFLSVKCSC